MLASDQIENWKQTQIELTLMYFSLYVLNVLKILLGSLISLGFIIGIVFANLLLVLQNLRRNRQLS